jgi:SAM-dependent methyltransferase
MSDQPLALPPDCASVLRAALDQEHKIDRALESLGPISDHDVVVVGGGPDELARYAAARVRTRAIETSEGTWPVPDASADAIVSVWSGFRGAHPDEIAEADRVLRPGGRLLVVHDYGRDDVARLRGDLPEHGTWTQRDGPFLRQGFRIRVIHCFWTFPTIEAERDFLARAFGKRGEAAGEALKRPRLSYNVAVYHRTRGEGLAGATADRAGVGAG